MDVVEESNNIPDVKGKSLKDSANSLKSQMKLFGETLEEARERIDDTSRCFKLLESCNDILEDDSKEREDFQQLAFKTQNDKLLQLCKVRTNKYLDNCTSRLFVR